MPSISGQSILIIGGSSGIGFAVAKLALSEGVRSVAIASSNETKVQDAVSRLKSLSSITKDQVISGHVCPLGDDDTESRLEKLFTDVTTTNGGQLDHIISTAGRPGPRPFQEIDLPYLISAARLSLFTPLLLAKHAPKYLKSNPSYTSSLIFTSGRVAEKPVPGYAVYASYGAAIGGLTRGLALDLKEAGVRVNQVSPGSTDTEMWGMGGEEMRQKIREMSVKSAFLGKSGKPEEVAEAYVYLMKDTNTTGVGIESNGGWLLQQ